MNSYKEDVKQMLSKLSYGDVFLENFEDTDGWFMSKLLVAALINCEGFQKELIDMFKAASTIKQRQYEGAINDIANSER